MTVAQMSIYKDGELVGNTLPRPGPIDSHQNTTNIRIGANPSDERWFHGSIGEICVLRRAFSEQEVMDYFTQSTP